SHSSSSQPTAPPPRCHVGSECECIDCHPISVLAEWNLTGNILISVNNRKKAGYKETPKQTTGICSVNRVVSNIPIRIGVRSQAQGILAGPSSAESVFLANAKTGLERVGIPPSTSETGRIGVRGRTFTSDIAPRVVGDGVVEGAAVVHQAAVRAEMIGEQ